MIKNTLALWALLLSLSAHATTVSYYGYTLDTNTNIVTGGGLEWLQWEVTAGQSIDMALTNYASEGWRLATNAEVAALFNSFDFGPTLFTADESISQVNYLSDYREPFGKVHEFAALFGNTCSQPCPSDYGNDVNTGIAALFGADANNNGFYNQAVVLDDDGIYDVSHHAYIDLAHLSRDYFVDTQYTNSRTGVALVRASAVPLPAAGWMFLTALFGLAGRKLVTGPGPQ